MSSDSAKDSISADRKRLLFCPSAQPSSERSMILGIVCKGEVNACVNFLKHPVKVGEGTLLTFVNGPTRATEIFRFAAPCETSGCRNWSGCGCRVAERLVQILPSSSNNLPECKLRPVCRWFDQEGGSVCMRCPQVMTDSQEMEAALNCMPANMNAHSSSSDNLPEPTLQQNHDPLNERMS